MGTDIHGVFQRYNRTTNVWEDIESNYELHYFFDEVKRLADEHGDIRFVFGFDS